MRDLPPLPPLPESPNRTMVIEDEIDYILDLTLRDVHRKDPNILAFIRHFMTCRDSRQAARQAGMDPSFGPKIRNRKDISQAIERLSELSAHKYGFDATEVVERVKEVVEVDIVEFMNPDGSFKDNFNDVRPEVRRVVKKFKVKNEYGFDPNGMKYVTGKVIEVELYDKLRATELLGREKELFTEKKEVTHEVGRNMGDILLESVRRAEIRERERLAIEGEVIEVNNGVE